MYELGGNAFDAALAALAAACVVEPVLTSLGGGGFLLAHRPDTNPLLYDFFVQTPRQRRPAADGEFYPVVADFGTAQQEFHIGAGSIATPGTVRGLIHCHGQLGSLPLREIVAPPGERILLAGYGPGTKDVNKRNEVSSNYVHHTGRHYWGSPAIFVWQSGAMGEGWSDALSASFTGMFGLHESTKSLEAMKEGVSRSLEDLEEPESTYTFETLQRWGAPWFDWKASVTERTGISFGIDYTALYLASNNDAGNANAAGDAAQDS